MSFIFDLIKERKINTTEAIILQYYTLNNPYTEPNTVIAEELNISLSVVSRSKRKLIQLGLIEIQKNYTSGLARDADTISTHCNIVELFGLNLFTVSHSKEKNNEELLHEKKIKEIIEKHLRRSGSPVTVSNLLTQIAKIDGRIKPKEIEAYQNLIIEAIKENGYQWNNKTVFATLL